MTRQPVDSSNLKSVGYDPKSKTMHVEFHSGRVYEYSGVPESEHAALIKADSVGKHFHAHIRPKFEGKRLA